MDEPVRVASAGEGDAVALPPQVPIEMRSMPADTGDDQSVWSALIDDLDSRLVESARQLARVRARELAYLSTLRVMAVDAVVVGRDLRVESVAADGIGVLRVLPVGGVLTAAVHPDEQDGVRAVLAQVCERVETRAVLVSLLATGETESGWESCMLIVAPQWSEEHGIVEAVVVTAVPVAQVPRALATALQLSSAGGGSMAVPRVPASARVPVVPRGGLQSF